MTPRDEKSSAFDSASVSSALRAVMEQWRAKRLKQLEWCDDYEAAGDGANAHTFLARANVYRDSMADLEPILLRIEALQLKEKEGDQSRIASTRPVPTPDATAGTNEALRAHLAEIENWNHDQFVDFKAEGGSAYEAEDYHAGALLYERAAIHEMASHAIERALKAAHEAGKD